MESMNKRKSIIREKWKMKNKKKELLPKIKKCSSYRPNKTLNYTCVKLN